MAVRGPSPGVSGGREKCDRCSASARGSAASLARTSTLDGNDPKAGFASPNHRVNLSGLVLGCIDAEFRKQISTHFATRFKIYKIYQNMHTVAPLRTQVCGMLHYYEEGEIPGCLQIFAAVHFFCRDFQIIFRNNHYGNFQIIAGGQ